MVFFSVGESRPTGSEKSPTATRQSEGVRDLPSSQGCTGACCINAHKRIFQIWCAEIDRRLFIACGWKIAGVTRVPFFEIRTRFGDSNKVRGPDLTQFIVRKVLNFECHWASLKNTNKTARDAKQ
jgi:hypothetical protein